MAQVTKSRHFSEIEVRKMLKTFCDLYYDKKPTEKQINFFMTQWKNPLK